MTLFHRTLGQGPPLIILHGLFGSLDNWMGIAKALSAQYKVYLVDLRNHGKSFHHPDFNYPDMASDLNRWIRENDLDHYHLLGHSMGGKVAMFHALAHRGSIGRLLVIDIGPKAYPVHHQSILEGLRSINPRSIENRQQADELLALHVPEAGVRQFLLKNLKRNDREGFDWKLNLEAINQHIEEVGRPLPSGSKITVPTLFLRGGNSSYIQDSDVPEITRQFPNASIKTVEIAGHWIHAEAPQEFLTEIRHFINETPSLPS